MVVLEGGGMLTTGSNQYLQPDYLSPLPTTLDAKKSPLALLAQTCSQIGADSPNSKPLIPPLEKPKKSATLNESSAVTPPSVAGHKADKTPVSRSSPVEPVRGAGGLAFKPYETNVLSKKCEDNRPPSKAGSVHNSENDEKKSNSGSRAPSRKSASPPTNNSGNTPVPAESSKTSSAPPPSSANMTERGKSVSPSTGANEGASPIIRSGLEILHGHPKDLPLGTYKSGSALTSGISGSLGGSLAALCSGCPPGLEPTNPAFRPPFAGQPFSHHHAAMLAAGYPSAAPGPYVSYARVKTASGGEALVPVCKDPYCTGCQYSMHQQLLLSSAGPCPSGCTQCDHQKYGLAAAAALSGLMPPGPVPPPPPLSYSHQLGRPYVCSWIAGESYCGKRFTTSDELLQHLRTHTSLATAADSAASSNPMSLLNHHSFLSSSAALHRAAAAAYPNPPLSPLSAARYHPYSKPGLPASLATSPFSAFNPTALGPYYSPYSIYGQRIGAAAVHP